MLSWSCISSTLVRSVNPLPCTEEPMTTLSFITALFCQVDGHLPGIPKHPHATLWPSEIVTPGILHALKGVGNHAFYRWLTRDYRPDTVSHSLSTPHRCCHCAGFSMLLGLQRRHMRGTICGTSGLTNSIRTVIQGRSWRALGPRSAPPPPRPRSCLSSLQVHALQCAKARGGVP